MKFALRHWWVPALYALAVMWIYRDLWHQHGVATGLGWDTIDTHGPDLDFFARDLREGRFSLWNPYDKGGYPVFCDPVFDRYYPFNWPFAIWGAVFGTGWWLVQIKVMAHHVMAAVLMHAFARSRGLSVRAALVSGFALIACAPLLTHKASNILWPMVWIPLVWIAVDVVLARPSWRRGAALGGALLLPMTAGSPPGLFYSGLVILPYAVLRLVTTLRDPARRTRRELVQLAIAAGIALVIAALVAGVTVIPTGQLVELASRDRFAPPGREFALALSLQLPAAARGVFVRGAGLFELYLGATTVLLAFCAIVIRPRADRGAPLVLLGTGIVGVILAAGATGALLPFLVDHVAIFGMLRVPGRYKLLAAWSVAATAGYGVGALEATGADSDRRLRCRVVAVGAAGLATTVLLVALYGAASSPKERPAWWSIGATAIGAALIVAAVLVPRRSANVGANDGRRRARLADACVAALAVCVLLDAPLFTFVLPAAPPAAERRQLHTRDSLVDTLDGAHDRFRIYDEFVLGERAGARLRVRDFRGYPAVDPISLRRYVDVLDFAKQDPAILTDFNVRWILDAPHFRYGNSTSFVTMSNPAFTLLEPQIWEARHPAPLATWVGNVEIVERPKVLAAVRAIEDATGTRRRAVIEPADARLLPDAASLAAALPDATEGTLVSYEPDAVTFDITAPRAGLVLLNEILFPGWQVTVDGRAATALRANYLLRAVHVDAGTHRITWRFEPRRWHLLVCCYALALALIIAAAVAAWLHRRERRA